MQPLFDELCKKRLNKTIKVCEERGNQYGDTLRNCQWLVTRSVLGKFQFWGLTIYSVQAFPDLSRALAIAGLVDVKYQRLEGGYDSDHLDDGINYSAVLAELMVELERTYRSRHENDYLDERMY